MRSVRVVVIDDSVAIQVGLPVMLPELAFVGRYSTIEAFLAERPEAELVALDLKLSDGSSDGLSGIGAVRAVAEAGYHACLYTDDRRRFVLAQCLGAGAAGIVHKSDPAPVVLDAFIRVAEGETVISQSLVGLAELLERHGGLPTLTDRQREVLNARAKGEPWAFIAGRLFITEGVAREHMAAVNAKFADFLHAATPGELQQQLGIGPGDLLDE